MWTYINSLNSNAKSHLRCIDCCTLVQLNHSGKIKTTSSNILLIILKAKWNIYWKHLFTYWIQTDIKSAGNCRKRTYLENIQGVRKVALLLFEGVCSCRTLKQPVAVVTDGTLKHLQYFTWDSALLREGIAWSSTWNKAVVLIIYVLLIFI